MNTNKVATSFRLSKDALEMIRALSNKLGISKTSVIEQAVRKLMENETKE